MIRYMKHPLFKKELSHLRWTIVLMIVAILIPILMMLNHSQYDYPFNQQFKTIELLRIPLDFLGWLVLPAIIGVQFFYTRKDSVSNFLASLPFSRTEQLLSKYLAGVCVIAISYFTGFLILTSSYFSAAQPLSGSYFNIVVWFFTLTSSALLQYSFLFLMGTLMGNSLFAGIFGIFIFYAPAFLIFSFSANMDMFFQTSFSHIMSEPLFYKIFLPHYISYTNFCQFTSVISHLEFVFLVGGYLLLSFGLFLLAKIAFLKNDFEYNGHLFMFPWAEVIFSIGFTSCFGFLALNACQMFRHGWLYTLMVPIALLCFPLGYITSKKILQVTGCQSRIFQENSRRLKNPFRR